MVGVSQGCLHEEAVQLSLRQTVGTGLLNGVLGRNHDERRTGRSRHAIDGDLAFFHRLEKRRLSLRARAVNLISEYHVGEDRSGMELELARLLVVDRDTGHVAGKQVRGELDAREFAAEVCQLAGLPPPAPTAVRAQWYSQSVDSNYLTGKRVFIFGDATHALAAARIAHEEMGFEVVGLGTYAREFAREVRDAAKALGLEALITDDYLLVQAQIEALQPELILGTQMERHIAKRQGLPCAVISAPVHVQDFPARYAPQMGFEGANVLFDTWVHPLMMGLEEHLLGMFRGDAYTYRLRLDA